MLLGNYTADGNLLEGVAIEGRLTSSGGVTAPTADPKFTVTNPSTGEYDIAFTETYAQFIGCQVGVELTGTPADVAHIVNVAYAYSSTTNVLKVFLYNSSSTPAGIAAAFSFRAKFTETAQPA